MFTQFSVGIKAQALLTVVAFFAASASGASSNQSGAASPDLACSRNSACLSVTNKGFGDALRATSLQLSGIVATAKNSMGNGAAGVVGIDATRSKSFSPGVGVIGQSTRGIGVEAFSTGGPALAASSSFEFGATIASATSDGLFASSNSQNNTASGVIGLGGPSLAGNTGVFGSAFAGIGVAGTSNYQIGVFGGAGGTAVVSNSFPTGTVGDGLIGVEAVGTGNADPNGNGPPALLVEEVNTAPLIEAMNNTTPVMSLDAKGNMILAGTLTTQGMPKHEMATTGGGGAVAFTPSEVLPTVESFGEARLVNGVAHVSLDPMFSRMIDPRQTYLVFLTPLGNSRGLYVAQRKATGFTVAENDGGTSSLDFDYRLVAKPLAQSMTNSERDVQSGRRAWTVDPAALARHLENASARARAAQPRPLSNGP